MQTDAFNHAPAQIFLSTGHLQLGRPSMGAWITYGLGSEAASLPAFVVMNSAGSLSGGAACFGHGFLPSGYQGVPFHSRGTPILYTNNPPGYDRQLQRDSLELINRLNHDRFKTVGDPEIATRISQYEMAFRMQASVPELGDLSDESESTWKLYGPEAKTPGSYAYCCLMARRLAERGVRITQVYKRGWDLHGNVVGHLPTLCRDTDLATYALITDLKQRGMLDDTLVVWNGEFGRTVYSQGGLSHKNYGRDHHAKCMTVWLAGGGVKGGTTYGETDEFSYSIAADPVHVRDLNATILKCLGIDHARLTHRFQGLDQRLTGVEESHIVKDILG